MRSLLRETRHERRAQAILLRAAEKSYDDIETPAELSRICVFDICERYTDGGAASLRDGIGSRKVGEHCD